MRALVCHRFGHFDELVVEDIDDPVAGDGEVVIEIRSAGINFPDLLSISGQYQVKAPLPFVPGNEAAGVVASAGAGVERYKPGDEVIAMLRGGAFAEKCVASELALVPKPAGMSFDDAASIGVTAGTSHHALRNRANLQPGETLLVLGAAGGVGIAAVEIGKAFGARVIAAASSDEKCAFARDAGADATINYSSDDLREAIKGLTNGDGVDVVYDPVGGELAQQAMRGLAWHGRYLVVGFASGDIPAFSANLALLKEASIVGVWWGTWLARHPDEHARSLLEIEELLASGKLRPRVTATFALEDYKAAFRTIAERRALGKVVFSVT